MKVLLQNLGSRLVGAEFSLDRFPFVIGRRSDNDGCLPLAFISRHHCRFFRQDQQVLVQDLESYNGTFVNGRSADSPLPIENGDELTLGPLSFRVVLVRGPGETTSVTHHPTAQEIEV